ncbi:carboxymuconolactone decarboxylase family protein [Nonomuraea polychroma]|uniref:carboxymuconolactone decarboxylase family protein n=1 Tax=Nonomuraea polychroma TaxID=46176 RepID=UPI0013E3F4DD|nr:peroxidase-related enzyme [Nonomuraea polychroma]
MSIVQDSAASGDLSRLYSDIRGHFGLDFVPDVFKLLSGRPDLLEVFWVGYQSMFSIGVLPREVKELIAAFVSREVACRYCADAHTFFLTLIDADPRLVESLAIPDVDGMPIPENVRELLRFAARVTHEAHRIEDGDFDRLRAAGWDQEQILEAVWEICQFNAVARLANALGLRRVGELADP